MSSGSGVNISNGNTGVGAGVTGFLSSYVSGAAL